MSGLYYLEQVSHYWFVLACGWNLSSGLAGCASAFWCLSEFLAPRWRICCRENVFLLVLESFMSVFFFMLSIWGLKSKGGLKWCHPQRPIRLEGMNTTECSLVPRGDREPHWVNSTASAMQPLAQCLSPCLSGPLPFPILPVVNPSATRTLELCFWRDLKMEI
jgi:hypothetical protein